MKHHENEKMKAINVPTSKKEFEKTLKNIKAEPNNLEMKKTNRNEAQPLRSPDNKHISNYIFSIYRKRLATTQKTVVHNNLKIQSSFSQQSKKSLNPRSPDIYKHRHENPYFRNDRQATNPIVYKNQSTSEQGKESCLRNDFFVTQNDNEKDSECKSSDFAKKFPPKIPVKYMNTYKGPVNSKHPEFFVEKINPNHSFEDQRLNNLLKVFLKKGSKGRTTEKNNPKKESPTEGMTSI